MEILPIRTDVLGRGDDLVRVLKAHVHPGDVLVISSKVVAVTEGRAVTLASLEPRPEASRLSAITKQDPRFVELVLRETERMNGSVRGSCLHAVLTELKPAGMMRGRILCPNAGADQSNAQEGTAIPWPEDAAGSAGKLQAALGVPVIISDSCCTPGRLGVTAFALAVSGMHPVQSMVGSADLFGRTLRMTHEAIADQLATAANVVMGNAAESVPAALVRGAAVTPSKYSGWVEGIEPAEDLFRGML